MFSIDIPRSPLSVQRLELDRNGTEFFFRLKWISRYQRFYLSIYDTSNNPIILTLKLVPGAPINLGALSEEGPQGLFIMDGLGEITRDCFETGAYSLYYIDRGSKLKFPLTREYLIDTDIYEFILNYTASIAAPEVEPFLFLDGDSFEFLDGETFEFIS